MAKIHTHTLVFLTKGLFLSDHLYIIQEKAAARQDLAGREHLCVVWVSFLRFVIVSKAKKNIVMVVGSADGLQSEKLILL